MTYVFNDNFAGPLGAPPNAENWTYQTDTTAGEVETYTESRANSYLDGQGHLVIAAEKIGSKVTSARLVTRGLQMFDTGTWTFRAKFETMPGTWPAIWLLGQQSQDWPNCGEIDLMEWYGNGLGWAATTTVHTGSNPPGTPGNNAVDHSIYAPLTPPTTRVNITDGQFHTYQVKLTPDARFPGTGIQKLAFYLDGVIYWTCSQGELPDWPFIKGNNLYMLLNIAVGGDGGGTVPADFTSAKMTVDYARVWQDD